MECQAVSEVEREYKVTNEMYRTRLSTPDSTTSSESDGSSDDFNYSYNVHECTESV